MRCSDTKLAASLNNGCLAALCFLSSIMDKDGTTQPMSTPPEQTTPVSGAQTTPATPLAAHRVSLQEAGHTARISINPPLDVGTLAELAHLLDAWNAPPAAAAQALAAPMARPARGCWRTARGACANAR